MIIDNFVLSFEFIVSKIIKRELRKVSIF